MTLFNLGSLVGYNNHEQSPDRGAPVECYEFIGTNFSYRYTSSDEKVVFNSNTYVPLAMTRSSIQSGTHLDEGAEVTIELPTASQIIADYAFAVSPPNLDMTLYRYHREDDPNAEAIPYWKGRVAQISVSGHLSTIRVPSILANAMSSNVPSVYYQRPCNRVLFDQGCKVDRASNQCLAVVKGYNGLALQLEQTTPFSDGFLVGGDLYITGRSERRLILANVGDILRFNYPFAGGKPGDHVVLSAGCDHSFKTCQQKFQNGINFGGFPYIPQYNPFSQGF